MEGLGTRDRGCAGHRIGVSGGVSGGHIVSDGTRGGGAGKLGLGVGDGAGNKWHNNYRTFFKMERLHWQYEFDIAGAALSSCRGLPQNDISVAKVNKTP